MDRPVRSHAEKALNVFRYENIVLGAIIPDFARQIIHKGQQWPLFNLLSY